MTSRYDSREIGINQTKQYKRILKKRNVKFIRQYYTPTLANPSIEDVMKMDEVGHVWSIGDRFFKLAHQYYGDSELWWVIAWYNQTPTESHVEIGNVLQIPLPLEEVLRALGV
jgi:nucleoid-associated protein YgaU